MTIAQIYDQLGITPNLQAHMMRDILVSLLFNNIRKGVSFMQICSKLRLYRENISVLNFTYIH